MRRPRREEAPLVDARERSEVLTPNLSYIVQAPAGSGKTGLLVQRILRLLSVIDQPESIVAVTFTIKAATEMRERVVQALRQAESTFASTDSFNSDTHKLARAALDRDQLRCWNLIEDSGRLQIQTIDALCAQLVRQMPIVSDLGGISRVIEDAEFLYRRAARRALQQLAMPHPQETASASAYLFRRLALHVENDIGGLESQIAVMLGKRDQWLPVSSSHESPTVCDFREILLLAERELRIVFQNENAVDFIEITRAARKSLGEPEAPSDLLYALDYRIEHLLVDEFQDTSRVQYDLLEALTGQWSDGDGRTLFLVGDPLQSIYGFRAAEVALFQQCWEQGALGGVRLAPVRLQANFRSTPQIINWVQSELSPILTENDSAHGAVAMQPSVAARLDDGDVPTVIPFIDDNSGSQEADAVAKLMADHKTPGESAILVRSRSHVVSILRAFRRAEIRYQAVEIDPLGEQQHILDLVSLTRALSHPADRVAWLAVLRAPWCGLTLEDLVRLTDGRGGGTILDLISNIDVVARLSIDGRFRTVRVAEILVRALEQVGRLALHVLVAQTWYQLGGPSTLRAANEVEDAQTFLHLVGELEEGGLIRDFALLDERCSRLYAKPDMSGDCVRVMTIHEAKGLEFDTVILPHLSSTPPRSEGDLLVLNQSADGLFEMAARPKRGFEDADYERICDLKKDRDFNESKRLFYVACTRAKHRLILLGTAKQNKRRDDLNKANRLSFLGMIWDRHKNLFKEAQRLSVPVQADLFSGLAKTRPISRLPRTWASPIFERSIAWQPQLYRGLASKSRVSYEWVGGTSRHIGTVVHRVLRAIAEEGLAEWSSDRMNAIATTIEAELAQLGVEPAALVRATETSIRALQQTLRSARGRWILGAHPISFSEWPIGGLVHGRLVTGTVDRLFQEQNGRLWVVDYKTSLHSGGNLSGFLANEQERYRDQMENYAQLIVQKYQNPVSLGLYFPIFDGWKEWNYVESAASSDLASHG